MEARAIPVWNLSKAELRTEMAERLRTKGERIVYGGPQSKTELENEVVRLRTEQMASNEIVRTVNTHSGEIKERSIAGYEDGDNWRLRPVEIVAAVLADIVDAAEQRQTLRIEFPVQEDTAR